LRNEIYGIADSIVGYANQRIDRRIQTHVDYVKQNQHPKSGFKYTNAYYNFPVKTRQETQILLNPLMTIQPIGKNTFKVAYSDKPHRLRVADNHNLDNSQAKSSSPQKKTSPKKKRRSVQRDLW